jgi:hypothetical protein
VSETQPRQGGDSLEAMLAGDTLPAEAVLRRAEEKPPLYRAFRVAMYVGYLLVVAWFVISIVIGVYRSVYGPAGQALRQRDQPVQHP